MNVIWTESLKKVFITVCKGSHSHVTPYFGVRLDSTLIRGGKIRYRI